MYKKPERWSIALAREHFSDLVRAAAREPQRIHRRDQLVAVVVDRVTFAEFCAWKERRDGPALADAMSELRALLGGAADQTVFEERGDREDALKKAIDDHSG